MTEVDDTVRATSETPIARSQPGALVAPPGPRGTVETRRSLERSAPLVFSALAVVVSVFALAVNAYVGSYTIKAAAETARLNARQLEPRLTFGVASARFDPERPRLDYGLRIENIGIVPIGFQATTEWGFASDGVTPSIRTGSSSGTLLPAEHRSQVVYVQGETLRGVLAGQAIMRLRISVKYWSLDDAAKVFDTGNRTYEYNVHSPADGWALVPSDDIAAP